MKLNREREIATLTVVLSTDWKVRAEQLRQLGAIGGGKLALSRYGVWVTESRLVDRATELGFSPKLATTVFHAAYHSRYEYCLYVRTEPNVGLQIDLLGFRARTHNHKVRMIGPDALAMLDAIIAASVEDQ